MMGRRAVLAVAAIVVAWPCAACGIYCRHLAATARDAEREEAAHRSATAEARRRVEADRHRIAAVDARIKRLQAEQSAGRRVLESEAELEPQILELREKVERAETEQAQRAASPSAHRQATVGMREAGAALSLESCRDAEEELLRVVSWEKRLRGEKAGREAAGPRASNVARGGALLEIVGEAFALIDLPRHAECPGVPAEEMAQLAETYAAAQASLTWDARLARPPSEAEPALDALAHRIDELPSARSGVAAADEPNCAMLRALSALARSGAAIAAGAREDASSEDTRVLGNGSSDDSSRGLAPALLALGDALNEDGVPRDFARDAELRRLAARAEWARSRAWSFEAQRGERERRLLELHTAVSAMVEGCEGAHPVLTTIPPTPERFSAPPPIAF